MKTLSLKLLCITAAALLASLGLGCTASEEFRTQPLGNVNYNETFSAARSVLGQYFSVAASDPETGRIVARPLAGENSPDRLLGGYSTRKLATMQIRRADGQVYADIRVEVQKQDVGAERAMQPLTERNEQPSLTPAQETAAATLEQQQAWHAAGRDYRLENEIIAELLKRVAPAAPTSSRPAGP